MIKCPHCGRKIPYDANLCPYCGRSIKQFQQKDLLDDEIPAEMPEPQQSEEEVSKPSPLSKQKANPMRNQPISQVMARKWWSMAMGCVCVSVPAWKQVSWKMRKVVPSLSRKVHVCLVLEKKMTGMRWNIWVSDILCPRNTPILLINKWLWK